MQSIEKMYLGIQEPTSGAYIQAIVKLPTVHSRAPNNDIVVKVADCCW